MCRLCYDRAWYAKLGGCIAIKFMFERCALKWVYENMFSFLKALLFVMMDLTGEVSSGALDMAKDNLQKMLIVCVTPPPEGSDEATKDLQLDALRKVTHELVRQVTSPHKMVREQVSVYWYIYSHVNINTVKPLILCMSVRNIFSYLL